MTQEIVWEVPENLYREIVWAQQELGYPNVVDYIGKAVHIGWQKSNTNPGCAISANCRNRFMLRVDLV
ncbi:MAG: hypothetical protein ACM3SY_12405 [Candidatus Omnitrophota bacterium]